MEIRPNRVKQRLANGEAAFAVGGFYDSDAMDQFGPNGFDAVWLEGEHGNVDFRDIGDYTRACDIWGLTSVVRINMNEPGVVYRTLDRGAQGLVMPHVNTRAEAERFVDAAKFAPIGNRGMFTSRQGYDVPDYFQVANDHTLLVVLIEDIIAVQNLDEILEVDQHRRFLRGALRPRVHDGPHRRFRASRRAERYRRRIGPHSEGRAKRRFSCDRRQC